MLKNQTAARTPSGGLLPVLLCCLTALSGLPAGTARAQVVPVTGEQEVAGGERTAEAIIAQNGVPGRERIDGVYLRGDQFYLRLSDLRSYLGAEEQWDIKNKYELVAGDRRLKFTLGSPIVVVDNQPNRAVNLPRPVTVHRGALYAPAEGMAAVLSRYTGRACSFDPERRWLDYGGGDLDLLGVEINHVEGQGTQVRVRTAGPVEYETFSPHEGMVNITFQGPRADIEALRRTEPAGYIRKVEVFDQPGDVLQLTFHLAYRFEGRPEWIPLEDGLLLQLRSARRGERVDPGATESVSARAYKIQTIVIDAGHGGKDPGSIGPSGLKEKDVALDIALRLRERIQKDPRTAHIDVVLTRERDEFIPLDERYEIANRAEGDLFVSIHANAFHDRNANGFMTFFLAEAKNDFARGVAALENSALKYEEENREVKIESGDLLSGILGELISTKYLEESQVLADQVQQQLQAKIANQVRPRKVDQAGFLVLNGAMMPSVLVEVAFISNRTEEGLLKQTSFKNRVAEALHGALINYRERVEIAR
ncbi:MAG: N-acetylmuramoyl-L-alanine amidase [bacterium]